MTAPLWRLERAHLAGRSRPRIDSATLEIHPGCTAILGPSGAGKSSVLGVLAGFERLDSGKIERLFDVSPGVLPVYWAPSNDGLWPHLTVREHLRAVLPPGTRSEETLVQLLSRFDLQDKIDELPDQLSQGESGRLALVRALAADPSVLLLDEPLVHVNPAQVRKYWEGVESHRRDRPSVSLVFTTHSPELVLREADHVVCLNEGRVVYSGSVDELYSQPPTPELAWSLGPVNWFSDDDRRTWLASDAVAANPLEIDLSKVGRVSPSRRAGFALRPEKLQLAPSAESPLIVQQSHCYGSVTEVELLDEKSGVCRKFYQSPQAASWKSGDRVLLRVVALLLLYLSLTGCSEGRAAPQLAVRDVHSWSLPADGPSVPSPRAIHAAATDELFVLDNAGRVLVYDAQGTLLRQWRMPDYSVGKPEKIIRLRDGRLAVADTHYHRVVFFSETGEILDMRGSLGHGPGEYIYPVAVVEDDSENLYVGEYGDNDRVQKFDKQGNFLLQFGKPGTGPGEFLRPSGMLWHAGKIYIVDAFNNRIQVFSEAGEFVEMLGDVDGNLNYPYDIARNEAGELFVIEYGAGRVSKFNLRGKLLGRYGVTGSAAGEFTTPWGMTVDSRSRIFVADTGNRRVVRLGLGM